MKRPATWPGRPPTARPDPHPRRPGEQHPGGARNPDPSCNPYLTLAACLAAGLDGIERKLLPPEEITENIFEMNAEERAANGIEDLPDSLEHALVALKADPLLAEVLGPHILPNTSPGRRRSGRSTAPASPAGRLPSTWSYTKSFPKPGEIQSDFPRLLCCQSPHASLAGADGKSKNFSGFGLN